MEDDLKILKVKYLSNHYSDLIKNLTQTTKAKCSNTSLKTTTRGRRPQNIKSGISLQQLIGSYSNFKLKLRLTNRNLQTLKMKITSNERQPSMEDDLSCEDNLKACRLQLMSSQMENKGKHRGNLECGSAQPSLFIISIHKKYIKISVLPPKKPP